MLRYIGPFLRMNKLNIEQIKSQLFYLSKESLKDIVLHSNCGITATSEEFNLRSVPNIDTSILASTSPLLCIYKKSKASLKNKNDKLHWVEDKAKKDLYISSNGYMTLSLLELADYYKQFKDIDNSKYGLSNIYINLAKQQLDFYAMYLRNEEGVFINKKDCTDPIIGKIKLKDKNTSFKFSDQALLMNAYCKCSDYLDEDIKSLYKNFSNDILNMFLDFREKLYELSFDEQCKLCMSFNVFYTYSGNEEIVPLIMDIFDLVYEKYSNMSQKKLNDLCYVHLNSMLIYQNTNLYKFKEISDNLYELINRHYDDDLSMFIKHTDDKEINFSSRDIVLYLLSNLYQNGLNEEENDEIIEDVYVNQFIDSGIVLSWPEAPTLDDVERYQGFVKNSENLLDEQYFKNPTIPSPQSCESPSIFVKSVCYDKNKNVFKPSKAIFDSRKNLELFFIMIYSLRNHIN